MAIETSAKGSRRIALTPDRPVGAVTREALDTIRQLTDRVDIDVRPQEVPWSVPLDEDDIHAHDDPDQVTAYLAAASRPRSCWPSSGLHIGDVRHP